MGGNALKNAKTRRINIHEYKSLVCDIDIILKHDNIQHHFPKFYGEKFSFGDIDVLINKNTIKDIDIIDYIKKTFKPNDIYKNTDVISFDYKEVQIDFILTEDKYWESSITYFSYNDLGNLIGRLANKLGFRYGHFGLRFEHSYKSKKFKLDISRNPEKIFKFLGFNYNEYKKGFFFISDVFNYVIFSKYFDNTIYEYSNLNHQNKTRNKKRKTYCQFLEYIKNFKKRHLYLNKWFYVLKASLYFKINIFKEYRKFKNGIKQKEKIRDKFNANIVLNLIPKYIKNFDKKHLSNVMKELKLTIKSYYNLKNEDDFNNWILEARKSKIEFFIDEMLNDILNEVLKFKK